MRYSKVVFMVCAFVIMLSVSVFAQAEEPIVELPELIMVVLGVLSPIVIQFITKRVTNEMMRFVISLVLSGLVGFAAMPLLKIPIANTPETIIKMFAYASVAYKMFWKPIWDNPKFGTLMKGVKTSYSRKLFDSVKG